MDFEDAGTYEVTEGDIDVDVEMMMMAIHTMLIVTTLYLLLKLKMLQQRHQQLQSAVLSFTLTELSL